MASSDWRIFEVKRKVAAHGTYFDLAAGVVVASETTGEAVGALFSDTHEAHAWLRDHTYRGTVQRRRSFADVEAWREVYRRTQAVGEWIGDDCPNCEGLGAEECLIDCDDTAFCTCSVCDGVGKPTCNTCQGYTGPFFRHEGTTRYGHRPSLDGSAEYTCAECAADICESEGVEAFPFESTLDDDLRPSLALSIVKVRRERLETIAPEEASNDR